MKKFVLGFVCGAVLFSGAAVSADAIKNAVIGKKVDGVATVVVDGKTLNKSAITVEGTSYIPVRAMVDAVGKKIVSAKDGRIEVVSVQSALETGIDTKSKIIMELTEKRGKLAGAKAGLKVMQERLANGEDFRGTKFENGILESVRIPWEETEAYAKFSAEAAEYERQIAQLEAEISELEAQLAALK